MTAKADALFSVRYALTRTCATCAWMNEKRNKEAKTLLLEVFRERAKGGKMVSFDRLCSFLKTEYRYPYGGSAMRRHWLHS